MKNVRRMSILAAIVVLAVLSLNAAPLLRQVAAQDGPNTNAEDDCIVYQADGVSSSVDSEDADQADDAENEDDADDAGEVDDDSAEDADEADDVDHDNDDENDDGHQNCTGQQSPPGSLIAQPHPRCMSYSKDKQAGTQADQEA